MRRAHTHPRQYTTAAMFVTARSCSFNKAVRTSFRRKGWGHWGTGSACHTVAPIGWGTSVADERLQWIADRGGRGAATKGESCAR